MILMPFATKNRNSPENLLWTYCCGWSGEQIVRNFGETSVIEVEIEKIGVLRNPVVA